jgi:Universal stress protein UspA and related nucleotide-binding proteins
MRILYAMDGSPPSRHGEALASSLFDRKGVQIDVFTVESEIPVDAVIFGAGYQMSGLDVPVLDPETVAKEAAERLADEGFATSWGSAKGTPADEILSRVTGDPYDLVVMGGSHTTWMGNVLLGSASMHVLHESPISVLIAHAAPTGSGKVLVGVDGSKGNFAALDLITDVLDRSRCVIELATVVGHQWVPSAVPQAGFYVGQVTAEERLEEEQHIERGQELVERSAASLRQEGFDVQGMVLIGKPGPELLKEADNIGADLVVVGSRGLGTMRRTLLGSVSDQVVRHAPATLVARVP